MSMPVITSAPACSVVGDPVPAHQAGDRLLGHREGAAEAAALVGARRARRARSPPALEQERLTLSKGGHHPLAAARRAAARAGRGSSGGARPCAGSAPRRAPTFRTSWRNSQSSKVRGPHLGRAPGRSGTRPGYWLRTIADAAPARGRPRGRSRRRPRGSGAQSGAASAASPALAMGWPQQVWSSGKTTVQPSRSSTRTRRHGRPAGRAGRRSRGRTARPSREPPGRRSVPRIPPARERDPGRGPYGCGTIQVKT